MPTLPPTLEFLNPIIVDDLKRYGDAEDGGYVLPASRIAEIDALISLGIFRNWSLEEDIVKLKPDLLVHAYDHSISGKQFGQWALLHVAKFILLQSSIKRLRRGVGTYTGYRRFFQERRKHFRQRIFNRIESPADATIDTVFSRIPDKSHVFLKVDIEGAEYRVIPHILHYADRIDLMAFEFHDTDPLRQVFVRQTKDLLTRFEVVHVHGNNYGSAADDGLPDYLEITLLNRRFVRPQTPRRNHLPLPGLDAANWVGKPDMVIDFAGAPYRS